MVRTLPTPKLPPGSGSGSGTLPSSIVTDLVKLVKKIPGSNVKVVKTSGKSNAVGAAKEIPKDEDKGIHYLEIYHCQDDWHETLAKKLAEKVKQKLDKLFKV